MTGSGQVSIVQDAMPPAETPIDYFPSFTSGPEWENVEVSALMRLNTFDTGSNNQSGIFARANDVTSPSNSESSYYLYRLNRQESSSISQAQLLRKSAGGSFDWLEILGLPSLDSVPESEDIFLKLNVETLPGGSAVRVEGMASLFEDFSNPFGIIDFLDTSAERLLGPGSAGFRVYGVGPVNFDNFTVRTVPEPGAIALAVLRGAPTAGQGGNTNPDPRRAPQPRRLPPVATSPLSEFLAPSLGDPSGGASERVELATSLAFSPFSLFPDFPFSLSYTRLGLAGPPPQTITNRRIAECNSYCPRLVHGLPFAGPRETREGRWAQPATERTRT